MIDLYELLRQAGFRGKALKTMYGIVMAESGGNPRALNDTSPDLSYGLAQINMIDELGPSRRARFGLSSNEDLYDPLTNLRVAFRLSRGGRDFSPWTTYTSGRYKAHPFPGRGGAAAVAGAPTSGPGNAGGLRGMAPDSPVADYVKALGITPKQAAKQQRALVTDVPDALSDYVKALNLNVPTRTPQARSQVRASTPAAPPTDGLAPPGGGWGGSFDIATSMAALAKRGGLSIMSEKRETKNTASGGVSDHWVGSKDAYAYDLSNGGSPTPQMDAVARQLAKLLGVNYDGKGELVLTKTINGYRYQILYRTNVGGNHFDHIHVGVRRA